jgi:hypothetical protein
VRNGDGITRERRVCTNRRNAERALSKIQAQENDGAYIPQKRIKFSAWKDEWPASVQRENGYGETMAYAVEAFGKKDVRLGVGEISRFLQLLRKRKLAPSMQAKHLRVLSACLDSAIAHGYAADNPIRRLPKSERSPGRSTAKRPTSPMRNCRVCSRK